jgi:hypothetical protein
MAIDLKIPRDEGADVLKRTLTRIAARVDCGFGNELLAESKRSDRPVVDGKWRMRQNRGGIVIKHPIEELG